MKNYAVLLAAALALSAGAPAQAADTIKLGMVAELSGAGAPAGISRPYQVLMSKPL